MYVCVCVYLSLRVCANVCIGCTGVCVSVIMCDVRVYSVRVWVYMCVCASSPLRLWVSTGRDGGTAGSTTTDLVTITTTRDCLSESKMIIRTGMYCIVFVPVCTALYYSYL